MSPRRSVPITPAQAGVGVVLVIAAAAMVVGVSYLLLLPAEVEVVLPEAAPVVTLQNARELADPPCPSDSDLARRGDPLTVTSTELIDCSDAFDGHRVTYAGEAVGVVLQRSGRAWLHLNDDPYGLSLGPLPSHRVTVGGNAGMAVSVPVDAARSVVAGDFRHRGTGVRVVGTYMVTHPDDAGSPAIHAETVEIVRGPQPLSHRLSARRAVAAALAVLVSAGLGYVRWRQSRA